MRSGSGYDGTTFGVDPAVLKPALDMLPETPPQELMEFIQRFVPSSGLVGPGYVDFLNQEDLLAEHEGSVPSYITVRHGFFSFGLAGDGAPYAYDISTGSIYPFEMDDFSEGVTIMRDVGFDTVSAFFRIAPLTRHGRFLEKL